MFRTPGQDRHVIWKNNVTSSADDLEFNSIIDNATWSTNEALRRLTKIKTVSIVLDQWVFFLETNANVSDGANYQGRMNGANIVGFLITVDQADGRFELLDSTPHPSLQFFVIQYHEGSVGATCSMRGMGVRESGGNCWL